MFYECSSLTSLNLTDANLSNITRSTFDGISNENVELNLTNAIVPDEFTVSGYFRGYKNSWTIISDGMKEVGQL